MNNFENQLRKRHDNYLKTHYTSRQMHQDELIGGFDFQKALTGLFPEKEFHLPGYSFCGPGTQLDRRLKNFDPETGENDGFVTDPINQLDRGCYAHDIGYTKYDEKDKRHDADRKLIKVADEVIKNKNSTFKEKNEARLVKFLLNSKVLFGLGFEGCGCGCPCCMKRQSMMDELEGGYMY